MNNLANDIIKKIKDGEVNMEPRWHFVLKATLMVLGLLLAAMVAIYLFSFVLFTLHRSGLLFAPQFGYRGLMMFVSGTPWLMLSILGIILIVLYVLVSRYSFSYRKPLVYSMVGVVLLVISTSSLIQYFGIHDRVQSFVDRHNVPGLRPFYQDPSDRRPSGVERGVISEMTETGFILESDQAEVLNIVVNDKTKLPPQFELQVDAEVLIFGERTEQSITAFGIKSASENRFRLPPRNHPDRPLMR